MKITTELSLDKLCAGGNAVGFEYCGIWYAVPAISNPALATLLVAAAAEHKTVDVYTSEDTFSPALAGINPSGTAYIIQAVFPV